MTASEARVLQGLEASRRAGWARAYAHRDALVEALALLRHAQLPAALDQVTLDLVAAQDRAIADSVESRSLELDQLRCPHDTPTKTSTALPEPGGGGISELGSGPWPEEYGLRLRLWPPDKLQRETNERGSALVRAALADAARRRGDRPEEAG